MLLFERLKHGVYCKFQVRLSYCVRLYLNKPIKEKEGDEEEAVEVAQGGLSL